MQVGAEWTFVNKVQLQVNEVDQRNSYKVVAYEPLTVPAGTFDCYRVEGKLDTITYKQSFSRQTKETYWYCPKVGSFAKMVRDTQVISRDTPSSREKIEIVLVKARARANELDAAPAVDLEAGAGHERRLVGAEEHRGRRDVGRLRQPAERNRGDELRAHLGRVLAHELREHRRSRRRPG